MNICICSMCIKLVIIIIYNYSVIVIIITHHMESPTPHGMEFIPYVAKFSRSIIFVFFCG